MVPKYKRRKKFFKNSTNYFFLFFFFCVYLCFACKSQIIILQLLSMQSSPEVKVKLLVGFELNLFNLESLLSQQS